MSFELITVAERSVRRGSSAAGLRTLRVSIPPEDIDVILLRVLCVVT